MVPASWTQANVAGHEAPMVLPALGRRVRLAIVAVAIGLITVFALAAAINPYGADGTPQTIGTHKQLGLPECNFVKLTGLPCPSCGMTTSFALLMHGDIVNSLRANAVGTLLALALLGMIPYILMGAIRGRWLGIAALEPWLLRLVILFTTLALVRWVVLLAVRWWGI